MKYYFELLDENSNDLGIFIADATSKKVGINRALKAMKENNIANASLSINSCTTNNLLDVVDLEIETSEVKNENKHY